MARVPYRDKADLPPQHQDLLARPITLHKALVNSPEALRAFSALGQFIRHGSKLDPRLRELAILQVGWLARAPYEWSHHIKISRDFGVTDDDIHALISDTKGRPASLDALTRTVLPRRARDHHRWRGIGCDLRGACAASGRRAAGRSDCNDLVLQCGGSCPRHAAHRRRGRVSALSAAVSTAEPIRSRP